jgi:hypothetical protein
LHRFSFRKKKIRYRCSGPVTDFVDFVRVRLDHYRPLALIAENNLDNEENNKADNGDEIFHGLGFYSDSGGL